jgi:hypothetical protein
MMRTSDSTISTTRQRREQKERKEGVVGNEPK